MGRIFRRLRRLRPRAFDRADHGLGPERGVEDTDALAATGGGEGEASGVVTHAGYPPNYVKTDDGRPRR